MSAFAAPGHPCPHEGCTATFAKPRNLDDHLERIHHWRNGIAPRNAQLITPPVPEKPTMSRTYTCLECHAGFPTFDERAAHVVAEHEQPVGAPPPPADELRRALRCPECGREFSRQNGLSRHMAETHGARNTRAATVRPRRPKTPKIEHEQPAVTYELAGPAPAPVVDPAGASSLASSIDTPIGRAIATLTAEHARLLEQADRINQALHALTGTKEPA